MTPASFALNRSCQLIKQRCAHICSCNASVLPFLQLKDGLDNLCA